ncbi:class I SAM-dependent DNA methyltransferase [Amycolatopsis japonica]|uniref:class I SAM-dependent DNA methyltransferase n=1 Tax=Amycolatopsis japonica TaxID=208439 RepID=UPI00366B3C17
MTVSDQQYDAIAESFAESAGLPARAQAEIPSVLDLLGDIRDLEVLDLACGTGLYSRLAKALGARRVVGVDSSPVMIEVAKRTTRDGLGVDYRVHDVSVMPVIGEFDVVVAAFLLNYAPTLDALSSMCRMIADNLRPGGRFIGDIPRGSYDPTRPLSDKYGMTYDMPPTIAEGDEFSFTAHLDPPLTIKSRRWLDETYETQLRNAGLVDIEFHPWRPVGEEFDGGFWEEWTANPLAHNVSARKP